MQRLLAFSSGLLLAFGGAGLVLYIFAWHSMVNPALDPIKARLLILKEMFTFPSPGIETVVGTFLLVIGLGLMLFSVAPRRRASEGD
jgi:hypothetical protein